MGSNGNAMGALQPLIPIFKGEGYEFWSIRMRTLLKSQDLWDFVEQGVEDSDNHGRLRENRKKDSKALVIIQQAVHDSVFSRIASSETSKEAWSILQNEFQGNSKVLVVRLQSLRRDFETLMMNYGESVADFLSRATTIISQMRSYGEKITDQTIVEKVLRSLTPKFDHVVAAIEESKDLSIFSFDELMGSLQAHESRIDRSLEKNEEKAFQVTTAVPKCFYGDRSVDRDYGRGRFRGRGFGKGKGRLEGQRQSGEQAVNKNGVQCYNCKRYGHIKSNCWYKGEKANFVADNEESENDEDIKLFMAHIPLMNGATNTGESQKATVEKLIRKKAIWDLVEIDKFESRGGIED